MHTVNIPSMPAHIWGFLHETVCCVDHQILIIIRNKLFNIIIMLQYRNNIQYYFYISTLHLLLIKICVNSFIQL